MEPRASEPVPARWLIAPALWFVAAFALMAWLTAAGFYGVTGMYSDVNTYWTWGSAALHGAAFYRDVNVVYPPAAAPAFILPALFGPSFESYRFWFGLEMVACGIATVVLAMATLARLGATRRDLAASATLLSATPLLIGPLLAARFDLWPVALLSGSLAALVWSRPRVAATLLGLAIAAKLYAIVAVPVLTIYLWKRDGRRAALIAGAVLVATVAIVVAPFAVAAGSRALYPLIVAVDRSLQVESLGAAALYVLHELVGLPLDVRLEFSAHDLVGVVPRLLALAQLLALAAVLGFVYLRSLRRPPVTAQALIAVAASVAAFVALGKVYSDQYVIWLIPLVAVIPGRVGLIAIGGVALIAVLTTWFFPSHYVEYIGGGHLVVAIVVLVRVVATLVLSLFLARAAAAPAGPPGPREAPAAGEPRPSGVPA